MGRSKLFEDRAEAGRALAEALAGHALANPVVLAMPRGGVIVAAEIARALGAPLDLVLVRKIGVPGQPELAAAAVVDGDDPERVLNEDVVAFAGVSHDYIDEEASKALAEIERRRRVYLGGRPRVPLEDREAILVDDGIATGASVRAALRALRRKRPRLLVLAVPVAPRETLDALRDEVDVSVCLATPEPFHAIGLHYRDFHQVSDAEVVSALAAVGAGAAEGVRGAPPAATEP